MRAILKDPRLRMSNLREGVIDDDIAQAAREWDNDNKPALEFILSSALTLAIRKRFPSDVDIRQVTTYIRELSQRKFPGESVDLHAAEVQIRIALGELYLANEVDIGALTEVDADFLLELIRDLRLSESELDALIAQAEQLAQNATAAGLVLLMAYRLNTVLPVSSASNPKATVRSRSKRSGSVKRGIIRLIGRRPSGKPTTTVALWLRASALDDKPARNALKAEMKAADVWSNAHTYRLTESALAEVARLAFREDEDIRVIANWVYRVRRQLNVPQGHMIFESVVRRALGEEQSLGKASLNDIGLCQVVAFVMLTRALGIKASQLDAILASAEAAADRAQT